MHATISFNGDDIRKVDPKFQAPRFQQYLNAVNELNHFSEKEYGKNILALAIRWILDRGNTVALWGARHPDQLNDIDTIFGWSLSTYAFKKIDEIIQKHVQDPVGPEFMTPPG